MKKSMKHIWMKPVLTVSMLLLLAGCGSEKKDTAAGQAETTAKTENAAGKTENETGKTEKTTVEQEEVVTDGMIPVTGDQLVDGEYDISVNSSSSMFSIESCKLTVSGGKMTAKMLMGGKGYLYMFMGSGEDAEKASDDQKIPFTEEADGTHSFTVPVSALNEEVKCAAFSKKKELWYDRNLCFVAADLPVEAYKEKPYKDAKDLGVADGTYQVPVQLTGGSGKATVLSPAEVVVKDGTATATILWSSSKYDYMIVDGQKIEPEKDGPEENSVFVIPVKGFDYPLPVKADTTAMSKPHEIEYTLTFDSTGLK